MWICFNDAFVSIVKDPDTDKLLVRARRREHLVSFLGEEFSGKVQMTPERDYRFRAVVTKNHVAMILCDRAFAIDYGNFKDSVKDEDLHRMYTNWWCDHVRLTEDPENLDCMDDEDLMEFAQKHQGKLARYARVAIWARTARRDGRIIQALKHERTLERIYESLPTADRW